MEFNNKSKWVQIGKVGVDSGQIMITDPCYIDDHWKKEEYKAPVMTFIFPDGTSEEVKHCSKRWFELIERANSGELKLKERHKKPKHNFSYYAVCQKTQGRKPHGQIKYDIGHDGLAVAFGSGYGDGCYPVLARLNKEGRVAEVRIVMIDDEGHHPYEEGFDVKESGDE